MGNLPSKRVRNFDRPFTITSIDYADLIQVYERRRIEFILAKDTSLYLFALV